MDNTPQNQPPVPPAPEPTPITPPVETPVTPVESLAVETPTAAPVVEAPIAAAPVVAPVAEPVAAPAPNPFGGPVTASAEPAANPFAAANPVSTDPLTPAGVVAPVVVPGSTPESTPEPTPGKSKKKLIVLISAIVGGLILLAGAALAVYFLFFHISKEDYQQAFNQVTVVQDKYTSGGSISGDSAADSLAEAKTAYESFKTESAKLSELKALRNDKDLKAVYDAYEKKEKNYVSFADGFLPSLESFTAASQKISDLGTGSSLFSSANIQKTIDIYKEQDIKDATLKAYVDSAISVYTEILPQAKIYETTTSTSAQRLAAINAISASFKKLSTAATTMSEAIIAKTKEVAVKDELDALEKLATSKYDAVK